MKIIQLAHNATVARLIRPTPEVENEVSTLLSWRVEGHEFAHAFKANTWDGTSSFYNFTSSSFPAGFVSVVKDSLTRSGWNVQLVRRPLPEPLGPYDPIVDEHGNEDPRYDFQLKALRQVEKHGAGIVQVATGGGKCLGRDTPILMFDGSIKPVQDVVAGDRLMGPDSTPRNVLTTCSGRDPLYRVTPTKGDAYVVNNAHILSLKKTSRGYRGKLRDGTKYPKGEIANVNVEAYIAATSTFRHIHKGWRTGVNFAPAPSLLVNPYFLGLLLGDGTINGTVSLTTADPEMVLEVERQATVWGLGVMSYGKTGSDNEARSYHLTGGSNGGKANPLTHALRALGLGNGCKFIPSIYKTASRTDRMEMLAGIIDTDGYYDKKCFYVTLKEERLLDDVIYLARSLGFAAYKKAVRKTCRNNGVTGNYFSTVISGHLEKVPVRLARRVASPRLQVKDHLVTGLKIEPIGEGEYFGFEIDGDSLFMLGDFTVTHNTKIMKLIMARYRRPTLFLTTRSVLLYQMKDQLDAIGINSGLIGDGEFSVVNGVNLGMVQTFVARLKEVKLLDVKMDVIADHAERGVEITSKQANALSEPLYAERCKRRIEILQVLEMMEVAIGEEAHEAGGNSYFEILKHCTNARIRVALTATPFMKDDDADNLRLMAAFGPKLIEISEELLIGRGILAKPFFKFVDSAPHKMLRKTSPWQRAYELGYSQNPFMHKDICRDALMAKRHGLSFLTLVSRTKHGEILAAKMTFVGLKVVFLKGADNQKARKAALRQLSKGEIDGIIGTKILDVGVDVPSIGLVQLAGGMKAEVEMRQRIGRGLRAKKLVENVTFVADYSSNINVSLRDHTRQRRAIVEATRGFAEGILPEGQDFPWHLFAKELAA